MKIRHVKTELFHVDERTDGHALLRIACSRFCERA